MIEIRDLTFRYPEGGFSLAIPDLAIAAQRKVAIIGPSGSGKTTLLNILAGVLTAHGALSVAGKRLGQLSEPERRRFRSSSVGFVFQDFALVEYLNALDNVMHPFRIGSGLRVTEEGRSAAKELIDRVGLNHRSKAYPAQLSHGEKQRVAICRALVARPRLVLADEPTGNLDPATKFSVLDTLIEQCTATQATLVAVTHDTELLEHFDEVIDFSTFLEPVPA